MTGPGHDIGPAVRQVVVTTLTAAHGRQHELLHDLDSPVDTFTELARGRLSSDRTEAVLRSVSPISHPHGRAEEVARSLVLHGAGTHHGWPSHRAVATAPTEGELALAVSWRFTVPHRASVIGEVDNLWVHRVGDPLSLPEPLPERHPITVGSTAVNVGADAVVMMQDGVVSPRTLEALLSVPAVVEGGAEELSAAEREALLRVVRALVERDRAVLEQVGAYDDGGDPYRWTRDYGRRGRTVHLTMPPGAVETWPLEVLRAEDGPELAMLVVPLWTREEGPSDLSLELDLVTDPRTGRVTARFGNLHVL